MVRTISSIKRLVVTSSSLIILVVFQSTLASTDTFSSKDNGIDQLQKQLIDLRASVDARSEELSVLRQENKQKRKFMLSQIAELESSIEHKKILVSKLNNKLIKNKEFLEKTNGTDLLATDLEVAIEELTYYVSNSLPFKRQSRLEALEEMRLQLASKAVSAPRLANKLWAFVEDEIMLTKGNGIYRQIIQLDNEEKLVDVARVGMMMLFYRDGAGNVGMAKRRTKNNLVETNAESDEKIKWDFISLNTKDEIHQIHYLFDSFQKQVRFGEFKLPNALFASIVER